MLAPGKIAAAAAVSVRFEGLTALDSSQESNISRKFNQKRTQPHTYILWPGQPVSAAAYRRRLRRSRKVLRDLPK